MINIAICDDSAKDRENIRRYVSGYFESNPHNYQASEFEKGEDLLAEYMDELRVFDIIFMDIFMSGENGMQISKKIRQYSENVKIIFMSTSPEFALESYDVFAFGYLLKPLDHEKLRTLLDKYIKEVEANEKSLTINIKGRIHNIRYADIVYLESKNTAVIIHTLDKERYKIYDKLDNIEMRLENRRFLRCHQSYIVNMDHVSSVDTEFRTKTDDRVLIRKRSLREIREKYYKYILDKMEW